MLPAGVVERIDTAEKKIYVDRTKDQIKNAPGYDQTVDDTQYRDRLGGYYAEPYHIQTPGCDPGSRGARASHARRAGSRCERDPRRSSPGVPLLAELTN
jgi:hypothetical protein